MLMSDVETALDDSGATTVQGLRGLYDTLMMSNTTMMDAVEMALANTTATNVAGLRSLYDTLMSDYNTLMGAVSMATANTGADDVAGLRSMYDTLKMNYDTMNTAVTTALANTTATNVAGLRSLYDALKTSNDTLMMTNGTLNTDLTQAQTDRDKYKKMYEDAKAKLDAMETTDMDMTAQVTGERLAPAIDGRTAAPVVVATGGANLGTVTYQQVVTDQQIVVPRNLEVEGDSFTVALMQGGDDAAFDSDPPAENAATNLLTSADHMVAAPPLTGWKGVGLDEVTEFGGHNRAAIYSNIQKVLFTEEYPYDWPAGMPGEGLTKTRRLINVEAPEDDPAQHEGIVMSGTDHEFIDAESVPGSYKGAAGTFYCHSATGCVITRTLENEATMTPASAAPAANGGGWGFAADPGATVTDLDYIYFGAWLKKPTNELTDALIGAFAGGGKVIAVITALEGTAEYNGSATGFYAKRMAGSEDAEAGQFSATANLKAAFGDDNADGTIQGSITDFQKHDGTSLDGWMVTLGGTVVLTDETLATALVAAGTAAGTTTGSAEGASLMGDWAARLFDTDLDADMAKRFPRGVVGTFNATHGAGDPVRETPDDPTSAITDADTGFVGVIGGFGATGTGTPPPADDMM